MFVYIFYKEIEILESGYKKFCIEFIRYAALLTNLYCYALSKRDIFSIINVNKLWFLFSKSIYPLAKGLLAKDLFESKVFTNQN